MKFNISETFLDQKEDMSENDYFDKILDDMDDESNNKIIPEIPDNVFKAMTEFASSPKYLKIVSNEENGVDKIFIEATEFMNFCEARNDNVLEAAEAIIEEYQDKMPLLKRSDINIVFPSDSINKNILGGENLGEDIKNDWAMQLFTGCRRYGLRPRITGVTEADESSVSRQKDIKTTEGVFNSFLKKYNNHHDYDNIYIHMSQSSNYDKFVNNKTNTMIFDVMVNLSDKQKQSMSRIEIAKTTREYTSKAIDLFKGYKDELFNLLSKKLSKYNVKDLKIGKIDIKVILD